jgi:hypothetical protein
MRLLRRSSTVDLEAWCAHLRRSVPLLAVFNDAFLLRLIERPLEALELDHGDPRRMHGVIADGENFPGRSFTREGFDAIRFAVEMARADGIRVADLVAARDG